MMMIFDEMTLHAMILSVPRRIYYCTDRLHDNNKSTYY